MVHGLYRADTNGSIAHLHIIAKMHRSHSLCLLMSLSDIHMRRKSVPLFSKFQLSSTSTVAIAVVSLSNMASNTASDFNNIDVDLEAARHGSHSFVTAPPPPVAQQQANATNASSSKLSAAAASGNDDETTALNFDTPNNPTNSIDLSTASATPNVAIPIATAGGTANTGIQPEGGSSTSNQADSGVEQEAFTFDEWWPKEKLLNVKLSDSMAEAKFREERVGKLALAVSAKRCKQTHPSSCNYMLMHSLRPLVIAGLSPCVGLTGYLLRNITSCSSVTSTR